MRADPLNDFAQQQPIESVKTGVDFIDHQLFLGTIRRFDDAEERPVGISGDPPVGSRIWRYRGEYHYRGAKLFPATREFRQRLRTHQRRVDVGDDDGSRYGAHISQSHSYRVRGSALLGLGHDDRVGREFPDLSAHLRAAMANYDDKALRPYCRHCRKTMAKHCPAAQRMQGLRSRRSHAYSLAGRQYYDGGWTRCAHSAPSS